MPSPTNPVGIQAIASYLPEFRLENKSQFSNLNPMTLENSVGFSHVTRIQNHESPVDFCFQAFQKLKTKTEFRSEDIEAIVVVSHEITKAIPHLSAQLHGRLNLPEKVICFDFGLGCSGYVQALSILKSYMESLGLKSALLFNVEVLSRVLNPKDVNTNLIFGDAATCTLLSRESLYHEIGISYGTSGAKGENLSLNEEGLWMNGLNIYDFTSRSIPKDIEALLFKLDLPKSKVNLFAFHQASKRVVEKLAELLEIPEGKAPFIAKSYGNTGSCSVPSVLENELARPDIQFMILSGFGSGLAWANSVFKKTER